MESIKNIEIGAAISKPADPTKERSIFVGWYKDSGLVNEFQFGVDTITRSIVLYAKWEAEPDVDVTYTIEYYKQNTARDGYDLADTESLAGTPNTTVTASFKTYRGFSYDSSVFGTKTSGKIASDGSLVLKLFYTRNTYTISYELDGGTNAGGNPTSYVYGVGASLADARREGYTFTGWYSSSTISLENKVTSISTTDNENITLYAGWVINTSSLTIKPNGGNVVITSGGTTETITADKTYKQNQNTTLTYETPTKEDTTDESTRYTISYNADGGSETPVNQDAVVTKVTGYTFSGWTKGSGFEGSLDENNRTYTFPTSNNTTSVITANYTSREKSSTVSSVVLGTAPTKTGYTFTGWKSSTDGQVYNAGANYTATGDTTMTAQWTVNTASLTINPNGGSVLVTSPTGGTQETIASSKTYTQNYNTTLTYETPIKADTTDTSQKYTVSYNTDGGSTAPATQNSTRTIVTGYTFSSWTQGSGFKGTLNTTAKTYTFPADNGVTSTITASYTSNVKSDTAAAVTLGTAPTKAGYTFAGWKSSVNNQVYNAGASFTPTTNTVMTAQWTSNYSVDGKYYSTLASAYNSITGDSGIIKLEKDCIDASNFTIEDGKTVLLDLNGKTLTKATNSITNNGILLIQGDGTIKTTESMSLIKNNSTGILTIGKKDGNMNAEAPVIQGGTYAIESTGIISFNDGILKGTTAAVKDNIDEKINYIEDGYAIAINTQDINGTTYQTAYLGYSVSIIFNPNYEATEVITRNYAYNNAFGRLPTVTRTGYTLNGWWTDVDGGSQITESTLVPTEGTTYYAHWTVNTYTVTINKGAAISGVTGEGSYKYGDTVTVSATLNNNYTETTYTNDVETVNNVRYYKTHTYSFANWTGTLTSNSQTYAFTMPAENVVLTANGEDTEGQTGSQRYTEHTTSNLYVLVSGTMNWNGWISKPSSGSEIYNYDYCSLKKYPTNIDLFVGTNRSCVFASSATGPVSCKERSSHSVSWGSSSKMYVVVSGTMNWSGWISKPSSSSEIYNYNYCSLSADSSGVHLWTGTGRTNTLTVYEYSGSTVSNHIHDTVEWTRYSWDNI